MGQKESQFKVLWQLQTHEEYMKQTSSFLRDFNALERYNLKGLSIFVILFNKANDLIKREFRGFIKL